MTKGTACDARMLAHATAELVETYASRAAVAQAARHLASMPAEKRQRLYDEWEGIERV